MGGHIFYIKRENENVLIFLQHMAPSLITLAPNVYLFHSVVLHSICIFEYMCVYEPSFNTDKYNALNLIQNQKLLDF